MLNFKNIGTDSIYNDKDTNTRSGSPKVIVSFVYGDTSGALAPDNNDGRIPPEGSAWNIVAGVSNRKGNDWNTKNPEINSSSNHPSWELSPANTNIEVIGTGENENITFDFTNIISFTPTGNTEMTVLFSGFEKDADTDYDDIAFTLNIVKLSPPPTRGVINFYSKVPVIDIVLPQTEVTIDLFWSTFYVDKVILYIALPNMQPITRRYSQGHPVVNDQISIPIKGLQRNTTVIITIQAFDNNGNYLNNMPFTSYIQYQNFTDANGKVYPTLQVGYKLWMAANLDYETPGGGSMYYDNDPTNEIPYGRLYSYEAALKNVPNGWRLPTLDDWNELTDYYGGQEDAAAVSTALLAGGESGFNAQLGESYNEGEFVSIGSNGFYWATQAPYAKAYMYFYNSGYSIGSGSSLDNYYKSIRYVKDL